MILNNTLKIINIIRCLRLKSRAYDRRAYVYRNLFSPLIKRIRCGISVSLAVSPFKKRGKENKTVEKERADTRQRVREAFLMRVTRRNRNPLLRRRPLVGLAHWLPVSGNALSRKLAATADFEIAKHFHTLMVSTPPQSLCVCLFYSPPLFSSAPLILHPLVILSLALHFFPIFLLFLVFLAPSLLLSLSLSSSLFFF